MVLHTYKCLKNLISVKGELQRPTRRGSKGMAGEAIFQVPHVDDRRYLVLEHEKGREW
jgi:hypothetical protein